MKTKQNRIHSQKIVACEWIGAIMQVVRDSNTARQELYSDLVEEVFNQFCANPNFAQITFLQTDFLSCPFFPQQTLF